ncbi:hypothetical protein BH11PSE11_BH11PSE11_28180 [soil metagenome]
MQRTFISRALGLAGALSVLMFMLPGCEVAADVSAPAKYDANGISFAYPKNWKITQDEKFDQIHQITVESPGAAVFIATVAPGQTYESLADFATAFAKAAEAAVPMGMLGKTERIKSEDSPENRIAEKFSMSIAGVEVPHLREYRLLNAKARSAYLVSQTADEDRAMTSPGFALMQKSFAIGETR